MMLKTYANYAAAVLAHGTSRPMLQKANGFVDVWDATGVPSWQPAELVAAKAAAIVAINETRNAREQSTFTYLGKQIDADPVSVQRITVATSTAQMALAANIPYSLEWACADNSLLALDAMGVLGMMQALGSYGLAVHMHGRGLKASVNAATTVAQVNAVNITTGWPA
jgi:hypothetical protein